MFGMGMPEILLILAIALIVIGPKKLPDLAKAMGRALGEFKRATSELKASIDIDPGLKDVKSAFDGMNNDIKDAVLSDTEPTGEKNPDHSTPHVNGDPASAEPEETETPGGYDEALEKVRQAFGESGDPQDEPVSENGPEKNSAHTDKKVRNKSVS